MLNDGRIWMKIISEIILTAFILLLCACSTTTPDLSGYLLPYPIKEVIDGTAFYDGGTTCIQFILEDGSCWGLSMNKSIGDRDNPEVYKSISFAQQNYSETSKIQIERMTLRNGSREEYEVLYLLYDFGKKNPSKKRLDPMYWVNSILKEKEFQPTSQSRGARKGG